MATTGASVLRHGEFMFRGGIQSATINRAGWPACMSGSSGTHVGLIAHCLPERDTTLRACDHLL